MNGLISLGVSKAECITLSGGNSVLRLSLVWHGQCKIVFTKDEGVLTHFKVGWSSNTFGHETSPCTFHIFWSEFTTSIFARSLEVATNNIWGNAFNTLVFSGITFIEVLGTFNRFNVLGDNCLTRQSSKGG
jgi:hypothetical protein